MSIELDPVELGFRRPFTQEVSEVLRLRNPNSDPLAFKVKTTAPKQYCVRPNSGRIEAGETVEVSVLLQAMKEDPPLDAKCRDKFLVQSVAISADQELNNVAAVWSNIESTAKSSIQERKIRVSFLPADGSGVASTPVRSSVNNVKHEEEAPAYSSPMSIAATPQHQSTAAAVGSSSKIETRADDSKSLAGQDTSGQSALGGVAASIASVLPISSEDVKAQLAEAQATIGRLTSQIQEQGLRQRKTETVNQDSKGKGTSGTTGIGVQQAAPSGVPVPIAAALCLLSFLLAYLFF